MHLSPLDFAIIAVYLALSAGIGIWFSKRASGSTSEFFLSGRKLPWWLAGTGMVATTFAADTPLAVAGLVAKNGIAGNWMWWSFVAGSMMTVFFFARLWRRAQVLTDLEFIELRYSGTPALFLRSFKAVYFGVVMNSIIIGWVNLAMYKIIKILLPEWNAEWTIVAIALLTMLYSGLGGLWSVSVTDAIQFVIAMSGSIALAVIALNRPEVTDGGGLLQKLPDWMFQFLPTLVEIAPDARAGGALELTVSAFLAMVGVQWWASWYPGAEPGGGGYIAQRMMSTKDERHALLATLWFSVAHYCVRPWPWILVGLVSVVMFPLLPLNQKEDGFVYVMRDVLPDGAKGLLFAAFLAAYMSTLSTHLNWGASYLLNDFYKRLLKPSETESHYVRVARMATVGIMLLSLFITFFVLESISGAWAFLLECGAGTGFVLIMRWFWWRLNAWSEIASMVTPFLAYAGVRMLTSLAFPESLFVIVSITISVTIAVTFLTKPESIEHLKAFYAKVRVGGWLWRYIAKQMPEVKVEENLFSQLVNWFFGVVMIYAWLFGVGKLIFGQILFGLFLLMTGIAAGLFIYNQLSRESMQTPIASPSVSTSRQSP
ncbi:MAG: sodium:solute symporter family protein [Chloroherpetonaceae bacterium]|nr:Na+:solute symporter [Chloroherpetonaceae bacterium]MCS7212179.1 Na+:solute symporter [Chloroherpetonaceae bacterium]MDW8018791.1 sodium:solute symporter family protein [Chloroherpetonaceae bacterium]